jgi:uncharacterized membrane-anchored protein YhcB (DUF1043 family)
VILVGASVVLLQALVVALVEAGVGAGWAALIVGAVAGIAGLVLVRIGLGSLSTDALTPERTLHQVQKDLQTGKEQLS